MSNFRKAFPKKHTLLAVIHCNNATQTIRNAQIAHEEGCDGIFLINHHISVGELLNCYEPTRLMFPSWFVGLNILGLNPYHALEISENISPSPSGLWTDDVGYNETKEDASAELRLLRQYQKDIKADSVLLFGGIAFKYQVKILDPAKAAKHAVPYLDVITTSGEGTGIPADVDKIRKMKDAIGDHPLAIASGITPENIQNYMPCADCFLVATGISHSHTELDPARVAKLVKAIAL